ncbi:MAG TPA: hypothetical protein VFK85_00135 [Anaeromyxobacteraceae bacterium]|nr:hypothetical protein [Anaeromyxobacteraceae bacterium]
MLAVHLARVLAAAFALVIATAASPALAKPWQGVTPGVTTQAEVVKKFGEPSTQGKVGARGALVYREEQAIAGTRQAQFFTRADGVVDEITVFPAAQLDRESVEGTYGKSGQKTFTDDFKPVWVYRSLGVMVFFAKDGSVEAIRFHTPQPAAARSRRDGDSSQAPAAPAEQDAAAQDGTPAR